MLKERNVINKILLILILIYSNNLCFSQSKIIGNYYQDNNPLYVVDGGETTVYSFYKNGVFERNTLGELGKVDYGKGHYFIRNDSLILNYDLTELKKESYHKSFLWKNKNNFIKINISVKNFENKPISYCNMGFYKDMYGIEANKKGAGVLSLEKKNKKTEINISFIGYKPYNLLINQSYNYKIEIFLERSGNGTPIINQIDTLKIIDFKNNSFKTKDKKGNITLWKKYKP